MKGVLITILLCSSCFACNAQKKPVSLEPDQFKKLIEETKDLQLIDVRTQKEFDEGKIKGAALNDFYRPQFRKQLLELDKEKPIAVYCTIGGRSGSAAKMLYQLGFKEIYDLKGGIIDWQKVGFKLDKD